ncbi:unnamed protein product [Calypogeia fissa]
MVNDTAWIGRGFNIFAKRLQLGQQSRLVQTVIMKALSLLKAAAMPAYSRPRYHLGCADKARESGSSSSGSNNLKAETISNNSVDKETHALRENSHVVALEVPDSGRKTDLLIFLLEA